MLYGFTSAGQVRARTPDPASAAAWGPGHCRWLDLRFVPCASSTPPTGTWGGPSTGRACSAHQAAFVDHLLDVVERERVDAGRGRPATSTTGPCPRSTPSRLADEAFARLAASRARVVVTSGNHDSAQRLGFGSRLIDAAGVHLRTDAGDGRHPGPARGRRTARSRSTASPTSSPTRSARAVAAARPQSTRRRSARRCAGSAPTSPAGPRTRSVVLAHAFVAGGRALSESERDISVGGVSIVPTSSSTAIDYAALGHLHGRHSAHRDRPLQRLPAGLLLLRGRPPQGLLARRPRTPPACADGRVRRGPVPRPLARLRGDARRPARRPAGSPATRRLGAGDPHRRRSARAQRDGPAARALPPHAGARLRARRPAPTPRPRPPAPRAAPTTTSPSTSSPTCAALRRPTPSPRCCSRPATPAATTRPRRTARGGRADAAAPASRSTAFGPFADTGRVDFDALSAAGLFLLTGADRRRQDQRPRRRLLRALRRRPRRPPARQAPALPTRPPTAAPRGSCSRSTLAGRRFRIARSPAWQRPKKRGTGTTTEQASCISRSAPTGVAPAVHPARRGRPPDHAPRRA